MTWRSQGMLVTDWEDFSQTTSMSAFGDVNCNTGEPSGTSRLTRMYGSNRTSLRVEPLSTRTPPDLMAVASVTAGSISTLLLELNPLLPPPHPPQPAAKQR